MRFKQIPICALFLFVFCHPVFAQDGDMLLWDGLENSNNWSLNAPGNLAVSSDHKTEGNSSLAVNVNGQAPATGVVIRKANTSLDVSLANKVVLDIYNSGAPCQLALGFETDSYHESVPQTLNSGMNSNVTFEISSKDFKAPFDYSSTAKNVMFVVYPSGNSVDPIYLDNIRVKKYGGLVSTPPGISPAAQILAEEPVTPEVTPEYTGSYGVAGFAPREDLTVPEHKTAVIFGLGLVGLLFYRKKS